ncbi:putative membrane protein YngC [Siminovitchia terrae]|uniref:DedA family protein n=1 Tax=Siminovitchia terrae TaxID=1914933 RepID=A0A429X5J3_SIMTE|nr:DedA family protein [Siminovitchia terrae]RST58570.1 DedA family protein [Siminovitchia terrae]GIN93248.1 putative membrane protein YngC [Siminovitchia terrae]
MFREWAIELLQTLGEYGFIGIAAGLMVEIIPSEIVLGYGGYLIASGKITFFQALIAGVFGGTMAQLFLYWLGIYGGRPFFDRYGKFLFIQSKHLNAAENWFAKHGTIVIFTARFIPVIRHAISVPAGIAKMPFHHFTILTVAAMIPWTVLFLLIGIELGNHWDQIGRHATAYLKPIIGAALAVLLLYFLFKLWSHHRMSKNN